MPRPEHEQTLRYVIAAASAFIGVLTANIPNGLVWCIVLTLVVGATGVYHDRHRRRTDLTPAQRSDHDNNFWRALIAVAIGNAAHLIASYLPTIA